MLQNSRPNRQHGISPPEIAVPRLVSPAETLDAVIGFVRRQYAIILFVAAIMVGLGSVYVFTAPPSYTAQATMMIDTRKVQLFQQQPLLGDIPIDAASVESQVEILKSENVALAVIKELHLTEDPEFVGVGGGLIGAIFDFASSFFGPSAPSTESEFERTRRAIGTFQSRLAVKRLGLTYVIEIRFRSLDPAHAAQIANAVADAYMVDQLEAKYQATRRASAWLQDRIRELRDQASAAERAVVTFKTQNDIVDAGGRLMNEQQLAELNSQILIAREKTSEAKARLDRIEQIIHADAPDASVNATVSDTFNSQIVTKLRTQYLEWANKEAEWSARYGRNHLAAINLRNQMREIRTSILEELKRLAESHKSDYAIALQREESLQKALSEAVSQTQVTNRAQITLRELESTSQTYRALHDNFLQRYMESVQQQSFPISEARLISSASRPLEKSHPRTTLVLAIASLGGIFIGVGLGLLRDLSDRVFRTSDQVEALLETDCIAIVPKIISGKPAQPEIKPVRAVIEKTANGAPPARTIMREADINWTVIDSPFSRFAEAIRSIKLATDLNGVAKSNTVIGFTSSLPNEGKSTIATAMAQLVGRSGAKVIVVDCDLRNPSISRRLAPNAKVGILDVILGKVSIEEAVWRDRSINLTFLPSVGSRLALSGEILASDAMKKLIDRLRAEFDYVLVDLPPLAPIVDVRATTHLVDAYVFVIEWGRTKIDVVEKALATARGVYENLLGVVLNKADISALSRYDAHQTDYYYNKHYGRYGYME